MYHGLPGFYIETDDQQERDNNPAFWEQIIREAREVGDLSAMYRGACALEEIRERRLAPADMTVKRVGGNLLFRGLAACYHVAGNRGTEFVLYDSGVEKMVERIQPGAFASSIARSDDVRFVSQHDAHTVMARSTANTLKLTETSRGLEFEARVDSTNTYAATLANQVERGDISQCSFAFSKPVETLTTGSEPGYSEVVYRDITDFGVLFDVCGCTFPAYSATTIQLIN